MLCKLNKTIGLIHKLQNLLPRTALITLYKAFVFPHDYGDILYDQAHNPLFHQKLESLQYNGCLAITGAICGSSREKLFGELGLESLQQHCWYRKLCSFYKIFKNKSPRYLFNIISIRNSSYIIRNHANIPLLKTNLRNSDTYGTFKNTILKYIRPSPKSVFKCHNPQGIKFLTRLRLGLSHLREYIM